MDNPQSQPAIVTPRRSRRVRVGLTLGGVAPLILTGAIWTALQPWTANHFGYALPGKDGLPDRITYEGTPYFNRDLCAGASYCHPASAQRWTKADLDQRGIWPLKQVGSVFTLFGPAHPLLEPVDDPSMAGEGTPYVSDLRPFLLFIPDDATAYFVYQRPGGP